MITGRCGYQFDEEDEEGVPPGWKAWWKARWTHREGKDDLINSGLLWLRVKKWGRWRSEWITHHKMIRGKKKLSIQFRWRVPLCKED